MIQLKVVYPQRCHRSHEILIYNATIFRIFCLYLTSKMSIKAAHLQLNSILVLCLESVSFFCVQSNKPERQPKMQKYNTSNSIAIDRLQCWKFLIKNYFLFG